jgi:hypothetical protein
LSGVSNVNVWAKTINGPASGSIAYSSSIYYNSVVYLSLIVDSSFMFFGVNETDGNLITIKFKEADISFSSAYSVKSKILI